MDPEDKELEADKKRLDATKRRVSARATGDSDGDEGDEGPGDSKPENAKRRAVPDIEEIEVSPDGEDDDSEDDEGHRPSRRERRANRYREAQERAEAAERRAQELEERQAALTAQIAQALNRPAAAPPAGPQRHPMDEQIDEVYRQRETLAEAWQARRSQQGYTRQEHDEFARKARDLEMRQQELVARKIYGAPQPQVDPQVAHIRAVNADVIAHPQGARLAQGLAMAKMARNPAAANNPALQAQIINESFAEARKELKLPSPFGAASAPRREAAPREAARYGAQPRGGGGSPGGGGPVTVKMTPERKKMANAMFAHIGDEKKRFQLWAKKVGRKLDA